MITNGHRAEALGGGDTGRCDEEMADASVEEAMEEEISMAESTIATTMATILITMTSMEPSVDTGAPAVNVWSNPAQQRQFVRMDHGRTRKRSRTEAGMVCMQGVPTESAGVGISRLA